MGIVQHRQVKRHLETNYVPHVDISDYATRSEEDKNNARLTRALVAFALATKADIAPETACKAVIDGYDDNGIDAVYYSASDKVLYLLQSKWSNDGSGSLNQEGADKFVRGVKAILGLKFEQFNEKLNARRVELEAALEETLRIELTTVHSGSDRLGDHPRRVLNELLSELNDTGEVATLENMTQENLYSIVAQGGRADPVNIVIQLFDWGQAKLPYNAFYGQVAASDVAQWGKDYRHRIFSKNIRSFLGGSTNVNESISESLRKYPAHFWYLNNGITALCGSIRKRPIGGASHDAGTFDCEDVSIVNGAQTVGVISELGTSLVAQLQQARVPIRLISLEGCPSGFAMEVTRSTNTQNRVDARNFVALDPEQDRLRAELLVDGVDYEYRQGEGEPAGSKKFGLVDATIALACSHSNSDLAVQAKREIGKLWDDLGRPPYKVMFNSSLTGLKLWNLVQMLRAIDTSLAEIRATAQTPKEKNLVGHSNRIVAHIVMQKFDMKEIGSPNFNIREKQTFLNQIVVETVSAIQGIQESEYEDAYIALLFKNASKCKNMVTQIMNPTSREETPSTSSR